MNWRDEFTRKECDNKKAYPKGQKVAYLVLATFALEQVDFDIGYFGT